MVIRRRICKGDTFMVELLCPNCKKTSYSSDKNYFLPCPYCGVHFSGRYGTERRHAERGKQEAPCVLNYKGQYLEAESFNSSREGIGIKLFAKSPVAPGETLELSTNDLRCKARVIWVNALADQSLVGLQRIH